jgi:hypothetical protein
MKSIAWTIVLGIAAPALAWAAPQQAPDGIVTIRKRASTWSFKITPEGRKKITVEEKDVETDVPQVLQAVWAIDEPYVVPRKPGGNFFVVNYPTDSRKVPFFREGKRYVDYGDSAAGLQMATREALNDLQKAMVEEFYQVDVDFPGGAWDDLARLLRDRLAAAYEQQLPEILKPYLPAKIELEVSSKSAQHARYPAFQAKGVTLAMIRSFGPSPLVEGKTESTPRIVEKEDKSIELIMDTTKSSKQLILTDSNALGAQDALEVAFFHLGSKPTLPGADHVVALFEMAWKTRSGPLYAKVKYHPETKTLMVQGTYDEIQAADQVFATLTGRPKPIETSANPFDAITQSLQKIAELIQKQTEEKDK